MFQRFHDNKAQHSDLTQVPLTNRVSSNGLNQMRFSPTATLYHSPHSIAAQSPPPPVSLQQSSFISSQPHVRSNSNGVSMLQSSPYPSIASPSPGSAMSQQQQSPHGIMGSDSIVLSSQISHNSGAAFDGHNKYSSSSPPDIQKYHHPPDHYQRPNSLEQVNTSVAMTVPRYDVDMRSSGALPAMDRETYTSPAHNIVNQASQGQKYHYSDLMISRGNSIDSNVSTDGRIVSAIPDVDGNTDIYRHYGDNHDASTNSTAVTSSMSTSEIYQTIESNSIANVGRGDVVNPTTQSSPHNDGDRVFINSFHRIPSNPEKFVVEALRDPSSGGAPLRVMEASFDDSGYRSLLNTSHRSCRSPLPPVNCHQYRLDNSVHTIEGDGRASGSPLKFNSVRNSDSRMSSDSLNDSVESFQHGSLQDATHGRSNVDAQRMVQESLKVYFPSVGQTSLDDIRIDNQGKLDSTHNLSYSVTAPQSRINAESDLNQCITLPSSREDDMSYTVTADSSRAQQTPHQTNMNNLPENLQVISSSGSSQLVPENLCITEPQSQSLTNGSILNSAIDNRARAMPLQLPHAMPHPPESPMPPPASPMPHNLPQHTGHMMETTGGHQILTDRPPQSPMSSIGSSHPQNSLMNHHLIISRSIESPMPSHHHHQHGMSIKPPESPMPSHHILPPRDSETPYSIMSDRPAESHLPLRGTAPESHLISPHANDSYAHNVDHLPRSSEPHLVTRGLADNAMLLSNRTEAPQMIASQRQDYPLPPMRSHFDPSSHRILTDSSHMRDSMKFTSGNPPPRYLETVYRADLGSNTHNAISTPAPLTHSPMPGDPSPSSLPHYYTSYSPHGSGQQFGNYLSTDACMDRDNLLLDDTKFDRIYQDVKPFDQDYPLPMHVTHDFPQEPPPTRATKPKKPKEPKPPRVPVIHKCKECDRVFKNSTQLKNHMWRHTGEKPFTCDQCGSKFTQQGNLRAHRRIHTGERPYQCEVCKHCFTQLSTLKTHQKIHSDERPHKCTLCEAAFRQVANLKTHQVTHTGERPHKCEMCDKAFTQKSNLKAHINRVHNPDGSFVSSSRRGRKKNPAAIKPFSCPECGAKFTMMSNLKIHMKLHSGSREYACDMCGAAFSYRTNLKTHIQRMHNCIRKKVKCDECPASFRLKRCLKAHKRKRHPIKSLKIKILGESKYYMRERNGPGLAEDIDETLLEEAEEGEDRSYMTPVASSEPFVQMREPKEEPADVPTSPRQSVNYFNSVPGEEGSDEVSAVPNKVTNNSYIKQETDLGASTDKGVVSAGTSSDSNKSESPVMDEETDSIKSHKDSTGSVNDEFKMDTPMSGQLIESPLTEEGSTGNSTPNINQAITVPIHGLITDASNAAINFVENIVSELDGKIPSLIPDSRATSYGSGNYNGAFNHISGSVRQGEDDKHSLSAPLVATVGSGMNSGGSGSKFLAGSDNIERIKEQLTVNLERLSEEFKKNKVNNNNNDFAESHEDDIVSGPRGSVTFVEGSTSIGTGEMQEGGCVHNEEEAIVDADPRIQRAAELTKSSMVEEDSATKLFLPVESNKHT